MTLSEIMKAENERESSLQDIKLSLSKEIEEIKLDYVKTISSSPDVVIVKFSQLKNNIWSPEYYSQHKQAEYISKAIGKIETGNGLYEKLQEIINNKYAKIEGDKNKYPINDETIKIIKEKLKGVDSNDKDRTD